MNSVLRQQLLVTLVEVSHRGVVAAASPPGLPAELQHQAVLVKIRLLGVGVRGRSWMVVGVVGVGVIDRGGLRGVRGRLGRRRRVQKVGSSRGTSPASSAPGNPLCGQSGGVVRCTPGLAKLAPAKLSARPKR